MNGLKTLASIVDVYVNAENQSYYSNQADSVTDTINEIIRLREANRLKGAILLGIASTTFPTLNKTGNPFWDKANKRWNIVKQTKLTGIIGFDYETAVNNRLAKEGQEKDFVAQERKWGTKIPNTPFVEHTNKAGLYRKYLSVAPVGKPIVTYYMVHPEIREVATEEISPYQAEKGESRQGLENELVYRDYACDSINELTYKGVFEVREILQNIA